MRYLTACLIAAALSGCVPTGYKRMDPYGYDDTQVSENTWRIRASVNRYTKSATADDFALLRAAEIACQNHYRFFKITEQALDLSGPSRKSVITVEYSNMKSSFDAKVIMDTLSKKLSVQPSCQYK